MSRNKSKRKQRLATAPPSDPSSSARSSESVPVPESAPTPLRPEPVMSNDKKPEAQAPDPVQAAPSPAPARPTTSVPKAVRTELPKSVVLVNASKENWIMNDGPIMAEVQIVRIIDAKRESIFVQPGSKARIPPGYAYDRVTQSKYPRVSLHVRG